MPTYEYKCDACGFEFEKFQSITAEPIKKCPNCGKNKVRRLIGTGAGLIFKGSGFYLTDYRDASYKEKAKAESGEGKAAETKPTGSETKAEAGKSDTKPAEAAPVKSGDAAPAAKGDAKGSKPAKTGKKSKE